MGEMEKVGTRDVTTMKNLKRLKVRKRGIEPLCEDFHKQGWIHDDLRLVNFASTENADSRKIRLVDFDWEGWDGGVFSIRGPLTCGSDVGGGLDGPIANARDDRILSTRFEALEHYAGRLGSSPTSAQNSFVNVGFVVHGFGDSPPGLRC